MSFSKAQTEAISHKNGPALVLAGPGSGKTTVITYRIRHLIHTGIDGSHILVITFTRAAALEMRNRFSKLSDGNLYGVTFGTFHSVFFKILRAAYNYDSANILTGKEQFQIIRDIIDRLEIETDDEQDLISAILGEISAVKNSQIALEHYYSKVCPQEQFIKIYKSYEKKLSAIKKVDFDDILTMTYELLSKRKDILSAWQNKFQYILIDEFQDINFIQYRIIRLLASPLNNLFIVGDDDQSIYRFRGAKPEIMLGFEKDYPNARRILLDINFRSDACIVRTACRLISHNQTRFSKEIHPSHAANHPVRLIPCQDIKEENRQIISQILEHHANGLPYQSMAILFRTNLGARFLTNALMNANIPFLLRDTLPNLYEHWISQDILAYMRIASGSSKRALWLRIMNRPNRYISRDSLPPLQNLDLSSLRLACGDRDWMLERIDRLEYDLSMLAKMPCMAAVHYIRHAMHYEDFLSDYAKKQKLNLTELLDVLDSIEESSKNFRTLAQWEAEIEAYTESLNEKNSQTQDSTQTDAVSLCTLHAAKGLEYPVVFLPDVNEENIPHSKAALDTDIEEERRLFYVGITRAKSELYLYCLRERLNHQKSPSRFLAEMKKDINK